MKYVIASDLHGSVVYTKKLAEAFEREKGGLLILLGDIYYHGPRNPLPEGYDPKGVAGNPQRHGRPGSSCSKATATRR